MGKASSLVLPDLHQAHLFRLCVRTGKLFGNKEMRILMLGLDAAGKTSTSPGSPLLPASYTWLMRVAPGGFPSDSVQVEVESIGDDDTDGGVQRRDGDV